MTETTGEREKKRLDLQARWYVNGFPKSGTHLAMQMIEPLAKPMPDSGTRDKPWCSNLHDAFKLEWRRSTITAWHLADLMPGYAFKAHSAYEKNFEALLWSIGACHVFVYRDPRDVAVSLMYHVLSDDETMVHSGRDKLRSLGGKAEILSAIIAGYEEYPGVMARWEAYAPWLSCDWVFPLRFEEAISTPRKVADGLIRYALGRLARIFGFGVEEPETGELVELMVASAGRREESMTFRAGRRGDWQQEFDEEHQELFKQTDTNNWLARLGYADSPDWRAKEEE